MNITQTDSEWARKLYVLPTGATEDTIKEFIRQRLSMFDLQNSRTRRQWLVNSAFSRGQQWSVLDSTEDRLINFKPSNEDRKLITDDMIGPWKKHIVANMTIAKPVWEVQPQSLQYDSIMTARTANDVLDYYWNEWKFAVQQIALSNYLTDFGNGIIYLRFCEDKMQSAVAEMPDGSIGYNDDGTPIIAFQPMRDVEASIHTPHCLVCPLDPRELDDKQWAGMRISREVGYYGEAYGDIGNTVTAEGNSWNSMYALRHLSREQRDEIPKTDSANEVFFYQKPCKTNTDGYFIIYANGVLLNADDNFEWPLGTMDTYPIIHAHGEIASGEFWARSSIEAQIPLQKYLNMLRSSEADNAENASHTKWFAHDLSGVEEISDMNEVVTWSGQYQPNVVTPAQVNLSPQIESIRSAIRDIQNYHGASMGSSVSGVRSDLHAQNLQEQDLLPLTVIDNLVSIAYSTMGEKILSMVAEGITDERTLSFVRDGRPVMIKNFKGAMINGAKKVRVTLSDTRLRSKGAVKQEVYQWFAAGMITDSMGQPDPQKAMKLLEFALPESVFDDMRIHTNQAYVEQYMMLQREVAKPYPWQNHMVHLKEHQDFMNTPQFMQLVEAAEKGDKDAGYVVQLFSAHMQATADMFKQAAPKPKPEAEQSGESEKSEPAKQPQSKE